MQVYQAINEKVQACVWAGYEAVYVVTASGSVAHAEWRAMGHVRVVNGPTGRCVLA